MRINNILDNIEEGLFLLNKDLKIGKRYSRALEEIFNDKNIASQNFLIFLENKLPEKVINGTSEYLDLLISGDHDAEMLNELNPLVNCKFSLPQEGSIITIEKYLDFKFHPVDDAKNNRQLIVTVTDTTQQIKLVQKINKSEAKTKQQLEWINGLIHVDSQMLNEFMTDFQQEMLTIQTLLRENDDQRSYSDILEKVIQSMQMIKKNASLLELNLFVKMAHEYEDEIALLFDKEKISGDDFVPLVLKLHQMQQVYNEIKQLLEKLSKIHNKLRLKRSYENEILINSIKNLVDNLIQDYGKEITLDYKKFNPNDIPFQYRLITKEILIQLIRNAIIHGIEHPVERKKRKKNHSGILRFKANKTKKFYKFYLHDDGRGIQISESNKKADSVKKMSKSEVNKLNKKQVVNTINLSVSNAIESVDMSSGRLIGVDILKNKVEQLNGKIKIKYEQNKFFEFEISLPVN